MGKSLLLKQTCTHHMRLSSATPQRRPSSCVQVKLSAIEQPSSHLRTSGRRREFSVETSGWGMSRVFIRKRAGKKGLMVMACQKAGVLNEEESSVALQPPCIRSSRGDAEMWLEQAIFEIVGHLSEAPFLHLVYDAQSCTCKSKLRKVSHDVLADPDQWSYVRNSILELSPDGIILVQKLEPSSLGKTCIAGLPDEACSKVALGETDEDTDVWGLFVQAKSLGWNACYVLKTTRVSSTCGACTRFCVTRAKCFGAALATQMQNAWLL